MDNRLLLPNQSKLKIIYIRRFLVKQHRLKVPFNQNWFYRRDEKNCLRNGGPF